MVIEKSNETNELNLLFTSKGTIKTIKSFYSNNQTLDVAYHFIGKDTLKLVIPSELRSQKTLTIAFQYLLPVDTLEKSIVFLRREDRWYPLWYDDLAVWKLKTRVPRGYHVLSVGNLVGDKFFLNQAQFIWESEVPLPTFPLIIFSTSHFTKTVKNIYGKPINFYFSSKDTVTNNDIISRICEAFKFYNELLGEYPHAQLTFVEIPRIQFVQSLSSIIMAGDIFIRYFSKGLNEWPTHELAHQWNGSGIFIKSDSRGRWFMEESLSEYLHLMYIEKTQGEKSLKKALEEKLKKYDSVAETDKDRPLMDIKYLTKENSIIIYKKGPYIIHKIRNKIGDSNWLKFLREIYKHYNGRFFTYDDFKKTLAYYDKGGRCAWALEKYMTEKGMPEN